MHRPRVRFSIRSLMIGLAAGSVLAVGGLQVHRLVRIRADRLQQVGNYRWRLEMTEGDLAQWEAGMADPDERASLAQAPEEQRAHWIAQGDQMRRACEVDRAAIPRWQRLADRPWESQPADLYRLD